MSKLRTSPNLKVFFLATGLALVTLLGLSPLLMLAQTTISAGSIQGTITDPTAALIPGARITITNKATGLARSRVATGSGTYESGALPPGDYTVKVEAKGFQTAELPVTVQVGVTSNGNLTLRRGEHGG